MEEIKGLNISGKNSKFLGIKHCVCVSPRENQKEKTKYQEKKPRTWLMRLT